MAQNPQFLTLLTWKSSSRHNGVHFFDIATSKSAPSPTCFDTFYLQTCFAPQRLALFNFSTSKSGPCMWCFVHFDFQMCFAPQRPAIFHLSSGELSPHPPLQRAYCSNLRSHETLEKYIPLHITGRRADTWFFRERTFKKIQVHLNEGHHIY